MFDLFAKKAVSFGVTSRPRSISVCGVREGKERVSKCDVCGM